MGDETKAEDYPDLKPYISALDRKPPTGKQVKLTQELEKYVNLINPRETSDEKRVREEVLVTLSKLVNIWVLETLKRKNIPQYTKSGGELFVSGSYRLNVNSRKDDVDTICCVPKYISREDFFSEENDGFMLRLRNTPGVTHVNAIREAVVPIIEVVWNGIDLDVLMARLEREAVPKLSEILNDRLLVGLDDTTVKSINGPRVTELIIKLVPNYANFALVLRCVRKWAKARGIYGNKYGFLGGVNWAIMVAFCCQLYPTSSPSKLLLRFFSLFYEWKWPTEVRICHPYDREYLQMKQWNPGQDRSEKFHVMPILTPAYPSQNSSYNVSHSTLNIMMDEFFRAKQICGDILRQKVVPEAIRETEILETSIWKPLFTENDFFVSFGSYVMIEVFLQQEEGELHSWAGFVESRIRKLTEGLQKFPLRQIYPLPKKFEIDGRLCWYLGITRNPNKLGTKKRLDLSYEVKTWVESLYLFGKIEKEKCGVNVRMKKWTQLPDNELLFPDGKEKSIPLRQVWIQRRRAEQEELRKQPQAPLKRKAYVTFTETEQDILEKKSLKPEPAQEAADEAVKTDDAKENKDGEEQAQVVEDGVGEEEDSKNEEDEDNLLLSERLKEEVNVQKIEVKGSGHGFLNVPRLPGIDPTDIRTFILQ